MNQAPPHPAETAMRAMIDLAGRTSTADTRQRRIREERT
jgi:hypothetical protein